jgi:AcrR family transcriptional regulator
LDPSLSIARKPASKSSVQRSSPAKIGGKISKGERTRALIKSGIAELITENQSLDLTLDDICARTGLTVGAFYFHFANKDAALEEMCIDHNDGFYVEMVRESDGLDLEGVCRVVLGGSLKACVSNPAMFRASYTLIPKSMAVYKAWLAARSGLITHIVELVAAHRDRAAEPETADYLDVHLAMAGIEGFLENLYFGSDETMAPINKDPDVLVESLWAHWRAVLMSPASSAVQKNIV